MREPSHPSGAIPWRRSLRTRLALWTSLTSILLLAAVALIFYLAVRGVLIANTQAEMRGLSQQAAGRLEATLDSVQVSGRTLAGAASGLGRQPMDLRALMRATLDADPAIAGVMIAMEPGRLGPDDPGFDWYLRRQGPATLESRLAGLGYADFRIEPWYTRTVGTSQSWWSEAYSNDATAGDLFVTYNLPLFRPGSEGVQGGAIGMVSLDVPVRRLSQLLDSLRAVPGQRPTLLAPAGMIAVHPDPGIALNLDFDSYVRENGRDDLVPIAQAHAARQRLQLDNQRFIGNVGWRQNEQTFDALRGQAKAGPFALDLAYATAMREVWKKFPQDADVGALFADMGLRVLMVDADPQPALTQHFVIKNRAPHGLTEIIKRGTVTADCISTLEIPPANTTLQRLPKLNPNRSCRIGRRFGSIRKTTRRYFKSEGPCSLDNSNNVWVQCVTHRSNRTRRHHLTNCLSHPAISLSDTTLIVADQSDVYLVVAVAPVGVMIHGFGQHCNLVHERPSLNKTSKLKVAVQALVVFGPKYRCHRNI